MDIAGEGDRVIITWDGLVQWGVTDMGCSTGGRDGGFNGNGAFPISSGGIALGKMTGGLVTGFRLKDTTCGVFKEG